MPWHFDHRSTVFELHALYRRPRGGWRLIRVLSIENKIARMLSSEICYDSDGCRSLYRLQAVEGASGDLSEHSQLGSLFQTSKILVTVRYPTEYALTHRVGHA